MTNLRLLKLILLPSSATELQPKQTDQRTDISSNSSTENELPENSFSDEPVKWSRFKMSTIVGQE